MSRRTSWLAKAFVVLILLMSSVLPVMAQEEYPLAPVDVTVVEGPAATAAATAADTPFFVAINDSGELWIFNMSTEIQSGTLIGTAATAAVGDFDGDAFYEIAAIGTADRNLYLFNRDGGAMWSSSIVATDTLPATGFYVDAFTGDSALGDFDGDGRLDVAFSGKPNPGTELVQVQLNEATGWQPAGITFTDIMTRTGESIAGLGGGDFDEDGNDDLAAQHYWDAHGNDTHFLQGNGDGTFIDTSVFTNPNPGGVFALVSGDFNGDGLLDVVVGQDNDGDPGQTWIYLGDGLGGFSLLGEAYDTNPAAEAGEGQAGSGLADSYDIDNDGNLDVIAAAYGVGLLVFLGNGDGTFQQPGMLINAGTTWFKVAAAHGIIGAAPSAVTIAGPTTGLVDTSYTFTATVAAGASTPMSYTWQTEGQPDVVHTGGGLTDTVQLSWDMAGTKTITVTAENSFGTATDTHTVTINQPSSATTVTISGPTTVYSGTAVTFTAVLTPVTATLPITFEWQANGQTITHANVMTYTDQATFTFNTLGTGQVTVAASNADGTATDTHTVEVRWALYLPQVYREYVHPQP